MQKPHVQPICQGQFLFDLDPFRRPENSFGRFVANALNRRQLPYGRTQYLLR